MKIKKGFYFYDVVGKVNIQTPITLENTERSLSLRESENNPDFFQTMDREESEKRICDEKISSRMVAEMILKEARLLVQKR